MLLPLLAQQNTAVFGGDPLGAPVQWIPKLAHRSAVAAIGIGATAVGARPTGAPATIMLGVVAEASGVVSGRANGARAGVGVRCTATSTVSVTARHRHHIRLRQSSRGRSCTHRVSMTVTPSTTTAYRRAVVDQQTNELLVLGLL